MINHLWHSTLFALAAALLTLAFHNSRASVRYRIWLTASLKFLIPFSLLMSAGAHLRPVPHTTAVGALPLSIAVLQLAQPFQQITLPASAPRHVDWLPGTLLTLWASGFACIVIIRIRGWLRIRAAIRAGCRLPLAASIPVRATPG